MRLGCVILHKYCSENTSQILLREYYTNTAHCALKTLFRGSGASTSRTGLFVLSTGVSQNPGSGCIRYVCLYHMVAVCSTELPDRYNVQCTMFNESFVMGTLGVREGG